MLIDSHCHLDFHKFKSIGFKDYSEEKHSMLPVLRRAKNAEVSHILAIGTTLDDSEENVNIARDWSNDDNLPKIYAAIGIHPDHAIDYEDVNFVINTLQNLAKNKEVVCIGECGIDYRNGKENRQIQINMFEAQCELAKKLALPIEVHSRNAEDDTIDVLKIDNHQAIIHCFSGTKEFAKKSLDLGFYISFSGIVTFKNAKEIQEVAKYAPLDRILIETDAPFLAPTPYRGLINEPSYVAKIGEFIANLRGMQAKEIFDITAKNFFNIFTKAEVK